jgi:hypothetical protein
MMWRFVAEILVEAAPRAEAFPRSARARYPRGEHGRDERPDLHGRRRLRQRVEDRGDHELHRPALMTASISKTPTISRRA